MRANRVVPIRTRADANNEISIFMDLSPLSNYGDGKAYAKASCHLKRANNCRESGKLPMVAVLVLGSSDEERVTTYRHPPK
jgi:hypothetical protein